ncbi:MAG: hypothetical protein H7326_10260, partial [Bdellovibrionaceae bacterium]|nr:hypothetical protein [Pseudobdellovibrionaceae bacterium]
DFQNLMIEEIQIESAAKKWSLVKESGKTPETWKVAGDEKLKVNEKAVRTFITRLSDTAVTEYLDPSEQAGFKNPDQKMTLLGKDKKVLFVLEWGNTFKKKLPVGEKSLVLARSNLFKEAFGLDPSVIESWGLASLVPKEVP